VGVDGTVLVSNIGVAGCGHIAGMSDDWSVGLGYKWGKSVEAFHGCDLSGYESVKPAASPALTPRIDGHPDFSLRPAAESISVTAGTPVQSFAFVGTKAPPSVTLHGPNGEEIDANPNTLGVNDGHLIEMDPSKKSTVILVDHPSAGQWTSTLDSGSSPLASASEAGGLPAPEVTASVTGTGLSRVLHWTATPIAGQSVRFVENGDDSSRVITTTTAASGSVPFTPAPGSAGTRTIVAEVSQDGMPRAQLDAATYDAPARSVLLVSKRGAGAGTVTGMAGQLNCGTSCGADITPGQKITLTATPAKGSRFMGWDGACAGLTKTCTIALASSDGVIATFDKVRKPRITKLSPRTAARGAMITLHGSGLLGARTVRFGKVKATEVAVLSDNELRVVVPSKAKSGRIRVTGPGGTGRSKLFTVK
jgi:hypothetical protein